MEQARTSLRDTAVAAAATLLALIPFVGKAFTMDDPMFLWAARQIAENPLDPYGFSVHWYERPLPMWEVMKNPPLAGYYLALAGRILGWAETALHASFLVPAIAAVTGTYRLARRLAPRPLLAAAATLASPVFLVSSSNIMCDSILLACWVWALVLWIEGLDRCGRGRLFLAAALVSAASMTKYFGICLIPLLVVYAVLGKKNPALWLPPLLVPLVVLAGYQVCTRQLYGRGLLFDAAAYATGYAASLRTEGYSSWTRFFSGIVYTGGCALPALLVAPFLWSRKTLLAVAAAAAAIAFTFRLGWRSVPWAPEAAGWSVLVWVQAGVFAAGGILVLALAADDLRTRRDPDSLLLALWVFGTFLFAAVINWDVNGRAILPLAPASAILLARRLGPAAGDPRRPDWKAWGPVALSAAVALLVTWGDASFAGAQRLAAFNFRRVADARGAPNLWFEGHWGFQHYMDSVGGRPLNVDGSPLMPGDLVVIPMTNSNLFGVPKRMIEGTWTVSVGTTVFASTMGTADAAGFYASIYGPLPFRLGPMSPQQYVVHRIGGALQR